MNNIVIKPEETVEQVCQRFTQPELPHILEVLNQLTHLYSIEELQKEMDACAQGPFVDAELHDQPAQIGIIPMVEGKFFCVVHILQPTYIQMSRHTLIARSKLSQGDQPHPYFLISSRTGTTHGILTGIGNLLANKSQEREVSAIVQAFLRSRLIFRKPAAVPVEFA